MRGADHPARHRPGQAQQTRPPASRSFVQQGAPSGPGRPGPLPDGRVDGRRDDQPCRCARVRRVVWPGRTQSRSSCHWRAINQGDPGSATVSTGYPNPPQVSAHDGHSRYTFQAGYAAGASAVADHVCLACRSRRPVQVRRSWGTRVPLPTTSRWRAPRGNPASSR